MTASPRDDHDDIVRLTHAYCWALDTRDWELLRDVFTPDVEAELGAGGQHGVDEVIARVSSALEHLDASQHNVSTHQITVDGDTATGRCNLIAQHVRRGTEGGDNFVVGGIYHDRYVRTADGWRVAHRTLVTVWTDGNVAVIRRPRPA